LIEEDDLRCTEIIGVGGFAKVYRAELRGSSSTGGEAAWRDVAVKRLNEAPHDPKVLNEFSKEVRLISKCGDHPNLLSLVGVCVYSSGTLAIVTEFLPKGSVYMWLRKGCGGKPPPIPLALRILVDVARGMGHLHSLRVIHRDLKSSNLLLADDFSIRIADFGLSKEMYDTCAQTRVGTLQWVAPEVLRGEKYSTKADLWSYGVVMWEVVTAKIPFDGMNRAELARKVAIDGMRLPPPKSAPIQLLRVMASLWRKPAQRPDFGAVLKALEQMSDELGREQPV